MLSNKKIALIGAGAMGEAFVAGLLEKKLIHAENITATNPRLERLEELKSRYGVLIDIDNKKAAENADIIILAVKPQKLASVLLPMHGCLKKDSLVISIIAGASIETISKELSHYAVVRSMPNTPAQIGKGITVWTASEAVSDDQRAFTVQVLRSLGSEVFVESENYIDMATALSGSGPAYVFLMMEAMIDAGVHMGFSRRIAEELVKKTIEGSVLFAEHSGLHPAQLRNSVTSPGGTTAAAMSAMERGGIRTVLADGIWAAYNRCKELGKKNS